MLYTTPIFASEGVYDPDTSWWERFTEESSTYIVYLACRMGAIVKDYDFAKWVQTREDYKEWWNTGHISRLESSNGEVNYSFDNELMAYIKQCLDEYAAENQPFTVEKTYRFTDIPATAFVDRKAYNYFKSLVISDSYKYIGVSRVSQTGYSSFYTVDLTPVLKEGGGFVNFTSYGYYYGYYLYDFDWNRASVKKEYFDVKKDTDNNYYLEHYENGNLNGYIRKYDYAVDLSSLYNGPYLITKDGGSIRVYKTVQDFANYSVGQRKIYYTSNYYDYVPEDLTVSIDELQKTIEDMQDVIDKLLDQITNNTSESEIEELLKQILDELRKNPGTGGDGGGSGGGDINVDIDLSTTNSLLSKILAKVTQIFEKMNAAVEDAEQSALTKIQESLDEIIEQLKKIKRWTAIDTVVDGVDAIADWLDLIRGVLKDAKEGAGSAVASLSSAVGDSVDLMAKKFPFSIPWDILFFVSALSAEPQVPHFEIPFNIELSALDITIDYTMKLDFSQLQWLSDLSRLLLSMTYAVGLMKLTFGVTSVGKEE